MLLGVFRVDDDVVEVGGTMVEPMVENAVDEALEYSRRILEPEWHKVVLEDASWCLEVRLPFVAFPDPDVVKAGPEVKLGKDLSLAQGRQCLGDQGDGVLVFNRSPVEFSVIDYQPKFLCRTDHETKMLELAQQQSTSAKTNGTHSDGTSGPTKEYLTPNCTRWGWP